MLEGALSAEGWCGRVDPWGLFSMECREVCWRGPLVLKGGEEG